MEEMKRKRTRTEADLVAELDSERSKFFFVGLVVAFKDTLSQDKVSLIIGYHEDGNGVQRLRRALNAGGIPVGLVGVVLESSTTAGFYCRPFANDVRAKGYLEKQMQTTADFAKLPPTVTSMEQRDGWPQR